jgi:lysophospholipase L1-like esterase
LRYFLRILLVLVMLEALSRLWLFKLSDEDTFLKYAAINQMDSAFPSTSFRFSFHRYLGYVPTPNYRKASNQHNSLGFRGEEFPLTKLPEEWRIVCVGGSTTYGSFTNGIANEDYRSSYPYLLQQSLHRKGFTQVRVINAGVGGWRSWESLINFQFRLLPLNPDLVIIYEGVNDINARMVWPPEEYQADNSGAVSPKFSRVFMPPLWEYSTFLRSAMLYFGVINPHASLPRLLNPGNTDHYFGDLFLQQKRDGVYPDGIFKTVPAMTMLDNNKPVFFERNVASMIDIAQANHIKVIISTIAFDAEDFPDYPSTSSAEFVRSYEEHNAILQQLATRKDTGFIDTNLFLQKNKTLFADGHHFTAAGAASMADNLAGYIDAQHWLHPSTAHTP